MFGRDFPLIKVFSCYSGEYILIIVASPGSASYSEQHPNPVLSRDLSVTMWR